jgi:hypothetical protein
MNNDKTCRAEISNIFNYLTKLLSIKKPGYILSPNHKETMFSAFKGSSHHKELDDHDFNPPYDYSSDHFTNRKKMRMFLYNKWRDGVSCKCCISTGGVMFFKMQDIHYSHVWVSVNYKKWLYHRLVTHTSNPYDSDDSEFDIFN